MPQRSVLVPFLVLTLVTAVPPGPVHAQTVRGILVDEHTGQPVELGTVKLYTVDRDSLDAALTDEEGFFELMAPESGAYSLVAEAFGYWSGLVGPFEVDEDEVRIIEARIAARPMAVDGLTVEGKARLRGLAANGFYERMERGRGDFITPEEILTAEVTFVQQLFYGRRTTRVVPVPAMEPMTARKLHARLRRRATPTNVTPGQEVVPRDLSADLAKAATSRDDRWEPSATSFGPWGSSVAIRRPTGGMCMPWLYVDGIRVIPNPDESLADIVPMRDVRAVEIYRAPFEGELNFRDISRCECGALVFWTRRGVG